MQKLGKIAFVPVIASGLITAGTGAGVAMAASKPIPIVDDFSATANFAAPMFSTANAGAKKVATTAAGDALQCSFVLHTSTKSYYQCSDVNLGVTGWLSSEAVHMTMG